jgi:hypothetical protein
MTKIRRGGDAQRVPDAQGNALELQIHISSVVVSDVAVVPAFAHRDNELLCAVDLRCVYTNCLG